MLKSKSVANSYYSGMHAFTDQDTQHDSKGAFGADWLGIKAAVFPAPEYEMDIVPLKIISYLFISDILEYEYTESTL